jgi:outer membrane receptor for ferrienterochelin and colicin
VSASARIACLFAVIAMWCARPAGASVDAVVTGVVEDALLHPLQGATVVLHDSSGHTIAKTVTAAGGTFTFTGVPFGDYTVEASAPGLVGDHQHLQISASQVERVELVLVDSEEIVTIEENWAVPPPAKASGSVATMTRETLQELPGTEDRPVTDVVATQPGFVVDALGNVYARGNHANVQYQVDGIPVPDSVGSLFAASIPVRLVQALEVYTGGMPAEFGDRLGAVVNLVTRQAADHPEGAAQIRYGSYRTIEPGVTYSTPLGERTGMFVGGSLLSSQRALDAPSIDPLHDAGTSGRVFARLDYAPCDVNRYELFVTYAHNRFEIPIDPASAPFDPANPRPTDRFGNDAPAYVPRDTNATETEDELFAAMSYVHKLDHGQLQLAPIYKLSRGVLAADARHALGPTADPGATASDVTRIAHHGGAVAAYSQQTGNHLLKAGAQLDFLYGQTTFTSYARDDLAGGVDPTMTAGGRDHTSALMSGIYAQDHWSSGKLALDIGVRGDQLHVILADGRTDDATGVSPRLGASYALTKDTVGHVFTGVNWQPPAPTDAANAARALGVVAPGERVTYDLKPETDLYAEAGVQARVAAPVRAGLVTWGRYAYNQLDDTAIGSTSLLSNYNFSRGRAGGVEASLDLRVGPWMSAFANGSYGLAQGRGISSAKFLFSPEDLASKSWQTLDHAQTWTANGGATVRDGRFSLTGLATYGSGLRTGPANDQHVPGHVRADLSMQYTFEPHAYPIRVGVDVFNVFDAHYAYRIANGFVGSSYGAPRTVYVSLSIPLAAEPHHPGEK